MAKNKGYIEQQKRIKAIVVAESKKAAMISRQQTLDKVVIALGEMGLSEDEFRKFQVAFDKAERDFCEEILQDADNDEHIEYSKAVIDRAIKQYVPKDLFVPYEERYRY